MSPNAVDPRKTAPFRLYFWSHENLDGRALNWPDLDEDIGVEPLLKST